MTSRWHVERVHGDPADLHALGLPSPIVRLLRWCSVDRDAVVLGSTEPEAHVDHERAAALGVSVLRRRSGGGAVLVGPGRLVWADLVVPAGDALWDEDISRASWWLGDAWARALAGLGVVEPQVHRGPLVRRPAADRVCFAGLGAGEVTVGGRKLIGIAQRRRRGGALFQCAALLRWQPNALRAVLAPAPDLDDLEGVAVGLDALVPGRGPADLEAALEASLPE